MEQVDARIDHEPNFVPHRCNRKSFNQERGRTHDDNRRELLDHSGESSGRRKVY